MESRHSDVVSLHSLIIQSVVVPTVVTHNILLQVYCDYRKTEITLELYRVLDSPIGVAPSPTTFRILVKGLLNNSQIEKALELKDDMLAKVWPDPIVYNLLMAEFIKMEDPKRVVELYEEQNEHCGKILDGVVYSNLMKALFKKGDEAAAMKAFDDVLGKASNVRFNTVSYNLILDALGSNGKVLEMKMLYEKMTCEIVNGETFDIVDATWVKKFIDSIPKVSGKNWWLCCKDGVFYDRMIYHLVSNGLVVEAGAQFKEMLDKMIKPEKGIYVLLIEACFSAAMVDDATGYFKAFVKKMEE